MNFEIFRDKVLNLAHDRNSSLRQIQALITHFFKNKYITHLGSLQQYVVRCSMNGSGEVFKNITRCSYNPQTHDIKLQRCNYPEQQVFYCSMYSDTDLASSSMTCIVETAWEHIENFEETRTYCTLSRWQCTRPLRLWVLPFSEQSCQKNRDFKRIRETMTGLISNSDRDKDEMIKPLEFMSDIFSKRNDKQVYYKISSAFYNSLLFYEKFFETKYDGLIYPSANTEGAGLNIALKKELIDDKTLFCDVATMYSILRSPRNPKNITAVPASNNAWTEDNGRLRFTTIF